MSYISPSRYNNCNRCLPCNVSRPTGCGNLSLEVISFSIGDFIVYVVTILNKGPTQGHNVTITLNSQATLLSFPGSPFELSDNGKVATAMLPVLGIGETVQLPALALAVSNILTVTVVAKPSTCSPLSQTIITGDNVAQEVPEKFQPLVNHIRSIITITEQ